MNLKRINKTDEVVNFPDDYNDNLTEIEQELDNKVSNNRVKTDVPSGAVFTDTVYDDTEIKERVETLASGLEAMSEEVVNNTDRQTDVESQFQDVIENTTDKDVISAPEIIAARNGEANLKAR